MIRWRNSLTESEFRILHKTFRAYKNAFKEWLKENGKWTLMKWEEEGNL